MKGILQRMGEQCHRCFPSIALKLIKLICVANILLMLIDADLIRFILKFQAFNTISLTDVVTEKVSYLLIAF